MISHSIKLQRFCHFIVFKWKSFRNFENKIHEFHQFSFNHVTEIITLSEAELLLSWYCWNRFFFGQKSWHLRFDVKWADFATFDDILSIYIKWFDIILASPYKNHILCTEEKNCRFCFDKDENGLFFMQKAFLFLPQNYPFEKMSHCPFHFVRVRDRKRSPKK